MPDAENKLPQLNSKLEQIKELPKKSGLTHGEYFEGPIPHPSILKGYESVTPGAADRIIKMAEAQAAHRQKLEAEIVESSLANEKRGMNYSFVLTVLMIAGGAVLLMYSTSTAGYVAGYLAIFGPAVFQAGSYIYSKREEKRTVRSRKKSKSI